MSKSINPMSGKVSNPLEACSKRTEREKNRKIVVNIGFVGKKFETRWIVVKNKRPTIFIKNVIAEDENTTEQNNDHVEITNVNNIMPTQAEKKAEKSGCAIKKLEKYIGRVEKHKNKKVILMLIIFNKKNCIDDKGIKSMYDKSFLRKTILKMGKIIIDANGKILKKKRISAKGFVMVKKSPRIKK